ncbi:MAG: Ig-like domain-containing protein [Chloroflexota bacterium]
MPTGSADIHSLQRCPSGSGGRPVTNAVNPGTPTPGTANQCIADSSPQVTGRSPSPNAMNVAADAVIFVEFSEDVTRLSGAVGISCNQVETLRWTDRRQ